MSGHNKWSQIKVKKGKEDAKKSKIFSMYARIVTVESKKAKGDRNMPGLRTAIERAKSVNMPNDAIDRAVAKGVGGQGGEMEEVLYEAYGPAGVAFILEGITDNKNRTTQEIKHLLSQHGGSLGAQGSAAWAFQKSAEGWVAQTPMDVPDSSIESIQNLIEALEEHEDIKSVSHNAKQD